MQKNQSRIHYSHNIFYLRTTYSTWSISIQFLLDQKKSNLWQDNQSLHFYSRQLIDTEVGIIINSYTRQDIFAGFGQFNISK